MCPSLQGGFAIISSGFNISHISLDLVLPFVDFKVYKLTWDVNQLLPYSHEGLTRLKIIIMMTENWMP